MPQVLTRDGSVFNFSDTTSPDLMNTILNLHALGVAQRAGQAHLTPSDPAPFSVAGPPPMPPLNPRGGLLFGGPPPNPSPAQAPGNVGGSAGPQTEVYLRYYGLGSPPTKGSFGGHSYVVLRDPVTGRTDIARGGPSETYPYGILGAISDAPAKASNGQGDMTLLTEVGPRSQSTDANEDASSGQTIAGTDTYINEPFATAESAVGGFDNAVNRANFTYRPRSLNSNSYAFTLYDALTGRKQQPWPWWLPASDVDLRAKLPIRRASPPSSKY